MAKKQAEYWLHMDIEADDSLPRDKWHRATANNPMEAISHILKRQENLHRKPTTVFVGASEIRGQVPKIVTKYSLNWKPVAQKIML